MLTIRPIFCDVGEITVVGLFISVIQLKESYILKEEKNVYVLKCMLSSRNTPITDKMEMCALWSTMKFQRRSVRRVMDGES